MEAVMIAGAAALAVGGFYSLLDFLCDVGFCGKKGRELLDSPVLFWRTEIANQRGVKKMPRLYI